MKVLTTKGLGGASGISKFLNIGKTAKSEAEKIVRVQMVGVYASGGELTVRPKSSFTVPQAIADKYAEVVPPTGKPTQLVISDADYIPDQEYADVEN